MLHGFSGAAATWAEVSPPLAAAYQVITLDILGHGKSDCPTEPAAYRMPAIAADIISLLESLVLKQAHLLGYSMGGRLALYLALHFPTHFASLMLESASPGLMTARERLERRRRDEALAAEIEAQGIAWFVDYWESLPLWATQAHLPAPALAAQRQQRLDNQPLGLANSLRAMGSGAQPNLWPRLPALALPTLLIVGEADAKFRRIAAYMAGQIAKSQLVVLPAAGHNCHLEQPQAFSHALLSFLQSC